MARLSSSLARYVLTLFLVLRIASAAPAQIVLDHDEKVLRRILTFDEIPTSHGSGNLSQYSHLNFSSFKLIDASAAASTGLISREDSDCAASSPNALVASRHNNPLLWPRIVLDPTTASSTHLSPFFNFVGFNQKPMNYTPQYTTILVNAYGVVDKEIRTHYSLFIRYMRAGHQPSYPLNITRRIPAWGKNVNMVEMWAQTPDGTDWDFCIDNLMVDFVKKGDQESNTAPDYDIPPARMHVTIDIDI